MPQAVDSLSSLLEHLSDRLRDLEARVAALESTPVDTDSRGVILSGGTTAARSEVVPQSKGPDVIQKPSGTPLGLPPIQRRRLPATWHGFPPVEVSAGAFPTVGKVVLGFAGAFLLRALAESGSLPKLPILIVAILYACFWMIWSARTTNRLASVTYAVTSTLILSPLLWEATVRFQSISPSVSGATLVAYIILTLVLATSRELQLIPWVATLATLSTAIALIIATRQLVPLTLALLAIAAVTEISVCLGYELTFRVIPAIVAGFSVWLLVYILGSGSVPEQYRAAAPATLIVLCALLPSIYGASIAIRSFIQLRRMTVPEICQAAASFALAAFGILSASRNTAAPALGMTFLLLAAICYWGTLSRFAADPHARNRRVSATWAAALLLAGTFLLLPTTLQVPFLCVAALLAAIVYTRSAKLSLGLHASFYIASAAVASSLVVYVASALAGTVPAAPGWPAATVALTAALCYAIESRSSVDEGPRRLLWIVPASVVAFTIAAWTVTVVVRLAAGRLPLAPSHLSMIRTIVICVLALALGLASRRHHVELRWIAYAAAALGTLKLLFEDLPFGNPASLVVSFVFYGLILILLPRLTPSTKAIE